MLIVQRMHTVQRHVHCIMFMFLQSIHLLLLSHLSLSSCCMSLSAAARTALRSYGRIHSLFNRKNLAIAPVASLPQQYQRQQSPPAAAMSSVPDAKSAIDFLTLLQNLKLTKRTGWVRCNVAGPESIADHMYRMAMMAMLCNSSSSGAPNGGGSSSSSSSSAPIDSLHCMKMALVHDIAEAIVGDITPHCKVSDEEKFRLEEEGINRIKGLLGEHTAVAAEVEALWREYESQQTPASHLVKDFDKLEMILQAAEYEGAQGLALQQFFDSTQGKFKTDLGRAWAAEIISRRPAQQQARDTQEAA